MEKGGSRHFLSSRCYFSNFVGQAEKIIDRLLAEEKKKLRECKILSIFTAPRVPQNIPLLYYLVSVYDARKDTFSIGSRELTFTPNDVALIIGLPNNGDNIVMVQKPYVIRTKATLRKEIAEIDSGSCVVSFNSLLLHMWFLEHTTSMPVSFPEQRPRLLRWSEKYTFKLKALWTNVPRMTDEQVRGEMVDVTEDEKELFSVIDNPISYQVNPISRQPQIANPWNGEDIIVSHVISPVASSSTSHTASPVAGHLRGFPRAIRHTDRELLRWGSIVRDPPPTAPPDREAARSGGQRVVNLGGPTSNAGGAASVGRQLCRPGWSVEKPTLCTSAEVRETKSLPDSGEYGAVAVGAPTGAVVKPQMVMARTERPALFVPTLVSWKLVRRSLRALLFVGHGLLFNSGWPPSSCETLESPSFSTVAPFLPRALVLFQSRRGRVVPVLQGCSQFKQWQRQGMVEYVVEAGGSRSTRGHDQ
ncbi:hypothetical protein KSP40_PGU009028 [Platanthera guangdongensis]|uniref:Uncharacterized protein n=1 Tax=Platanthera guangdongensis TaxID=2320717 RepID=A0ABR2M6W3_9ASPA